MSAANFATCDLLDDFESQDGHELRVVQPMFKAYGKHAKFCGQIETLSARAVVLR